MDTSIKSPQVQDNYLDPNSLNSIKAMGRDRDPQAIKEVAKKFEGLLVQQMLKSMREANDVFSEGNFLESQTTRFHRDMLDQQMVINLTSGRGVGLADHFYHQMMANYGSAMRPEDAPTKNPEGDLAQPVSYSGSAATNTNRNTDNRTSKEAVDALDAWINDFIRSGAELQMPALGDKPEQPVPAMHYSLPPELLARQAFVKNLTANQTSVKAVAPGSGVGQKNSISTSQENFVMLLRPHAEKAAAELQINPDVLIAQVALETGWGKHVIRDTKGNNSFNLFNIKAGSQWQGGKVNVNTLEYRDGIAAQEKSDFRQYQNYAESFSDYVRLMKNSPRYEPVLAAGKNSPAYAEALQRAGYATDPAYAKKIKQLLNTDVIKSLQVPTLAQGVNASVNSLRSLVASAHRSLAE